MSPVLLWILVLVLFLYSRSLFSRQALFYRQLPVGAFIILIILGTFHTNKYFMDLPTPVILILLLLLLPSLLVPLSVGSVFFYNLVIAYLLVVFPNLPLWLFSNTFRVAFVLTWPIATVTIDGLPPLSVSSAICWMSITALLHDKIHVLMHIGCWIAWPAQIGRASCRERVYRSV